jgi:hypothetical protein
MLKAIAIDDEPIPGQHRRLWLSLDYDIVKAEVVTIQGGGTDFVINLSDGKGF